MTPKDTGGPEKRPARSGRSDATYEKAIRENGGNITATAAALGISRGAFYVRLNKSQRLKEVLEEVRNEVVDMAEDGLRAQVAQQNMTAIIWTLKAHKEAKRRGWGERQEVSGVDGGPIQHEHKGQTHGEPEHLAAVLAALARAGAFQLPGDGDGDAAEDDGLHPS
jgi:DNA invertase Pin-like site-specific DNA recombinase